MRDAAEAKELLRHLLSLDWEDEDFRNELRRFPAQVVEREALRLGLATDSIAECIEFLAEMPACPDTFASRPDDLFLFHEHLLGG